jgi:hypothetical protein
MCRKRHGIVNPCGVAHRAAAFTFLTLEYRQNMQGFEKK